MKYETIIEKHRGWQVVFRRSAQRYIILKYTCLACHHRTSRRLKKARVTWGHFYATVPEGKSWPHRDCYCGCDVPTGPDPKEQEKARRRLQYWKKKFAKHRERFFTGEINGRNQGRKM